MEIQVTERFKIIKSAHCYQLVQFFEGGKEVKNVKTGETSISVDTWRNQDVFYPNMPQMVKHIARLESDLTAKTLNDWLDSYNQISNEIINKLSNTTEL